LAAGLSAGAAAFRFSGSFWYGSHCRALYGLRGRALWRALSEE
jgi:hypothetical protein